MKKCTCCNHREALGDVPYCQDCWDNIALPANNHVATVRPDDPHRIMWHGWALREAFIAGASMQMQRERSKAKAEDLLSTLVFQDAQKGLVSTAFVFDDRKRKLFVQGTSVPGVYTIPRKPFIKFVLEGK